MHRLALLFALLILCLPVRAGQEVLITVLHINDVYQISPVDKGKHGGLARLATLKKQVQAESPHLLMTFGGDTLSPSVASNLFKGEQMIAGWNAVGLDAAVLGNHEFDFGPEVLKPRLEQSRFPWLGANVRAKAGLLPPVPASLIKEFNGIKIGLLGVITPSTAHSSKGGPDIQFTDPIAEARREAGRLRNKGANYVIALTHLDVEDDRRLAETGAVDLILGGHDHSLIQTLVGRTAIFKAGSDARLAARLDLHFHPGQRRLTHLDWQMLAVDKQLADEPNTAAVVAHYEQQLSSQLDHPVGSTSVSLDARQASNRSGETNLGNWLADVYRLRTGADVALVNGGSIRSNSEYGPGKLSRRDMLSILPFENPIVKLDITGKTLKAVLEHGVAQSAEVAESGRFPQVSGLKFSYRPSQPVGQRVQAVYVQGQPLDEDKHYSIAINGYLANGGDGYSHFQGQTYLISPENALSESAEVIEVLSQSPNIAPKIEGRIQRLP